MKTALLLAALLALGAQAPMPPPGNPGHQQPAPGQACKHDAKDPAHNCNCHRECKQNSDEDGNPAPGEYVQEDYSKCRASCYQDHCHCPVHGCS